MKIVTVVICVGLVLAAAGSAKAGSGDLLGRAARLSGLPARQPVPTLNLPGARYDALYARAWAREYTRSLQQLDGQLYTLLGLTESGRAGRVVSRAWYDTAARRLVLRREPRPDRKHVVHEYVRALVDQNFGLRRLRGLRARDRDRALAASAIVEGTAALSSGIRRPPLRGSARQRFLQLETGAGLGPGRALAAELRYLGGPAALATALRTFPQTTEQLLHVDKFLERERALPVRLPNRIGPATLAASQTFGELDVLSLLRAFGVARAPSVAEGWGGARIALYVSAAERATAAIVIHWDTIEDAAEWRDAVPAYMAAAFAGAPVRDCPPLDGCWSDAAAAVTAGRTSVFAAGQDAFGVAVGLLG